MKFYRNYAFKEMALSNAQPEWGSHRKCKELFGICFHLAFVIGSMIDESGQIVGSENEKASHLQFR